MTKFTAELIGDRLIIWDPEEGSKLYSMGYFGKPVGISKPKLLDFDVPLNIDLIEGLYLLEKDVISVIKNDRKRPLSTKSLKSHARKAYDNFESHYQVYKDLRDKGYIVLSGIKFGCEFAVYERGPGIDHAPYLISVRERSDSLTSTDIVRAGRLATTVRKRFIIAIPSLVSDELPYIVFKWFKA